MSEQKLPGLTLESFFETYEIVTQIGSGCFGQIFKVVNRRDQRHYSLKKVLIDSGYFNRELSILLQVQKTEGVLHLLSHLLVPVSAATEYLTSSRCPRTALTRTEAEALPKIDKKYENMLYLITKCYPMNLRSAVLNFRPNNQQAKLIVYNLCLGVSNLHKRGICHRDIKSENILVDFDNKDVCVADLGSAKEFTNDAKGGIAYICSRPYRAPELLLGHTNYDWSIDIWSIGCIIFEILSTQKRRLFVGDSGKNVLLEIIGLLGLPTKDDLEGLGEKRNITLVSEIPTRNLEALIDPSSDPILVQLMKECLRWNPKRRANLDAWLQNDQLKN